MSIAAVIAAAGLSSRMGDYKPMMLIGSRSVAQHVIRTFQLAGVDEIIVVTGHNAARLQAHLEGSGVTFLHNERYSTTDMFHSAKIGLSYAVNRHDKILFTPVDVPLASLPAVWSLIRSDAPLARLVHNGKGGHPMAMLSCVAQRILADEGDGGLKGAITRCGTPMIGVESNDPGVLQDADTPGEFRALLDLYSSRREHSFSPCPSEEQILQWYAAMGTPQAVIDHCQAVARMADELSALLDPSIAVDRPLLRAACRLHDAAKVVGTRHPASAAEYFRQSGYPLLGEIIEQHHDLRPDASPEAQLLYLSDKMVQGTQTVSLHDRFARSRAKCRTPQALQAWQTRYDRAKQIIEQYHFNID